MRTKRANRYSAQTTHNQFGIYNWFVSKGINNKEVIKEVVHNFCTDNGFDMSGFKFSGAKNDQIFNWVSNRFNKFSPYALNYLKENNYI